ncbi:MAG: hypothetical protein Q8R88_00140 [Desulfoprunum sp.]|nr:hypothetical protein [Desulfoprunum sp.]
MNYLHSDLTLGFYVILKGSCYSDKEFRIGDKLSITNLEPEDGHYALLKHHGEHEAVIFRDNAYDPSKCLLIGIIDGYERSCLPGGEKFLGEDDEQPEPVLCSGCDYLEVIEMAGKAVACCQTPTWTPRSRLVNCTSEKARKCHRGNRAGRPWGE